VHKANPRPKPDARFEIAVEILCGIGIVLAVIEQQTGAAAFDVNIEPIGKARGDFSRTRSFVVGNSRVSSS